MPSAAVAEAPSTVAVSTKELVDLCADDYELYCRSYFPRAFRQEPAVYHELVWNTMQGNDRLVNIQIHRDGAKTTLLRLFSSYRIAYNFSRTILYIGKSEGHAIRSLSWLRKAVEFNARWSGTFGLRKGVKWQDNELEIYHGVEDDPIWIMGVGITGSIRGINFDDYRPDLIIADDVIDDENAATPDQRKKISDLLHGAVKDSLAPRSEAPNATFVMLQTPLNKEDASTVALSDPEWRSLVFPCWTPETMDLPIDQQESSWPARFPSEERRAEKKAALAANRAHIWYREKECKLVAPETVDFRHEDLRFYEEHPPREQMIVMIGIDPVPPPSEAQIAKGMSKKDYEAFAVWGSYRDEYYLLEYRQERGHTPDWTVKTFFELCLKWRPRQVIPEPTAYQRTVKWILEKAMESQRRYFVINTLDGVGFFNMRKRDRILDTMQGPSSQHKIFVKREHAEFIGQFSEYPDVAHDDLLDASASALYSLMEEHTFEGDYEEVEDKDLVEKGRKSLAAFFIAP